MNLKSAALLLMFVGGSSQFLLAATTDPCSLLSTARVSTVLGVPVNAGKQSAKADCQWSQPNAGPRGKSVFLEIVGQMGTLTPVARFNNMKMPVPFKGVTKMPVSGLGDDAVYVTTGTSTGLMVKKGNFVFQIRVFGTPPNQVKAQEIALAQDVLAKL